MGNPSLYQIGIITAPGPAGGNNKSIQYNDNGFLNGSDNFTIDILNGILIYAADGTNVNLKYDLLNSIAWFGNLQDNIYLKYDLSAKEVQLYAGLDAYLTLFNATGILYAYGNTAINLIAPSIALGIDGANIQLGGSSSITNSAGGNYAIFNSIDIATGGSIEADDIRANNNFKSSDNSPGITSTFSATGKTITVKNGLITNVV